MERKLEQPYNYDIDTLIVKMVLYLLEKLYNHTKNFMQPTFKHLCQEDKNKLQRVLGYVIKQRSEMQDLQQALIINKYVHEKEVSELKSQISELRDSIEEQYNSADMVESIHITRSDSTKQLFEPERYSASTQTVTQQEEVQPYYQPMSHMELLDAQNQIKSQQLHTNYIHQQLNMQKQNIQLDNMYQENIYKQQQRNELNNHIINGYLQNLEPYKRKLQDAQLVHVQLQNKINEELEKKRFLDYQLQKYYPETQNIMKLKHYNIVSLYEPVQSIREMYQDKNIIDQINGSLPTFDSPAQEQINREKELVDRLVQEQQSQIMQAKYDTYRDTITKTTSLHPSHRSQYKNIQRSNSRSQQSLSLQPHTVQEIKHDEEDSDGLPSISQLNATSRHSYVSKQASPTAEEYQTLSQPEHNFQASVPNQRLLKSSALQRSPSTIKNSLSAVHSKSNNVEYSREYFSGVSKDSQFSVYKKQMMEEQPTKLQNILNQLSDEQRKTILNKQNGVGREQLKEQLSQKQEPIKQKSGHMIESTVKSDIQNISTASNTRNSANNSPLMYNGQEILQSSRISQSLNECEDDEVSRMINFINDVTR